MPDEPSSQHPDEPSLPPRHRPTLDALTRDTTELDLWDFEDDEAAPDPEAPPAPAELQVAPRNVSAPPSRQAEFEARAPAAEEPRPDRMWMHSARSAEREVKPSRDDFDDLDDEVGNGPPAPAEPPSVAAEPPPAAPAPRESPATPAPAAPESDAAEPETTAAAPRPAAQTATAEPWNPLRTLARFSIFEKGLLVGLALALLGAGIWFLNHSVYELPAKPERVVERDLPIRGERVMVESVETYWRRPVLSGDGRDAVRRGTVVMPIAELTVVGPSGALRLFFRDGSGTIMGDVVTRPIEGETRIVAVSSVGFDEMGLHEAYRTGDLEPWTIEVSEGPSTTAPAREFERLFEMEIAPNLR